MIRLISLFAAVLAVASTVGAATPETDEQKTIYSMGYTLAGQLANFGLSADELELFKAGLTDGALGRQPQVELEIYGSKQVFQSLARERMIAAATPEKEAASKVIDEMAQQDGAIRTGSGLVYIVLEEGDGASPTETDTVTVHYHGTLRDGTVFDSSLERGSPATFPLKGVIKCWTEGVQMMKVGGKSQLVCPSDIAYGDMGRPPTIMPGAMLVFEVELLDIQSATQ